MGGAGRPHPGRAAGGQPRRELQPGRRVEGHVGAHAVGRRARASSPPAERQRPVPCGRRPPAEAACRFGGTRSSNSSSNSNSSGRGRAEPHRRVAVLDRALHRAGRGHRPHPRRPLPPAARGPVGRRGRRVRRAARGHGRRRRTRRRLRLRRRHSHPRVRRGLRRLDRGLAVSRLAATPAARGRRSRRRCGSASTPPTRSSARGRRCPTSRAPRLLPLGEGAGGDVRRPGRLDDEPRRRVAVPPARAEPRAGGHDRPPAVGPVRRELGRGGLGDDPALAARRLRGLPAHVPAGGRRLPGGRVPRARPAVPALGVQRAAHGRGVPGRAGPVRRTRRLGRQARRSLGQARTELEFRSGGRAHRRPARAPLPLAAALLRRRLCDRGRYFRETARWSGARERARSASESRHEPEAST